MKRLLLPTTLLSGILLAWVLLPRLNTEPERSEALPAASDSRPIRQLAITRALGEAADPNHVQRLLAQTDALQDRHPDPQALKNEIQRELERAAPSEAQLRDYHAQRPELFAHRSFEQSRPAIEQILKVRLARAALLGKDEADLPHIPLPEPRTGLETL